MANKYRKFPSLFGSKVDHDYIIDTEPNKSSQLAKSKRKFDARKYINDLPNYNGWEEEVKNIIPYDKELIEKEEQEFNRLVNKKKIPEPKLEKVYIDTLKTKQPYLNRKKLLRFLDGDYIKSDEPIKAVRYKGEVILTDGNHRIAIAKLNSQKDIDVLITDLDKKRRR